MGCKRFEYRWLQQDSPLYRNFVPSDVETDFKDAGIAGCILIEAANTTDEIPWLLQLADEYEFIQGVIGWLDWDQPQLKSVLETHIKHPHFKGARLNWLENSWTNIEQLKANLKVFNAFSLSCDLLTRINLLSDVVEIIRPYEETCFVFNHFAGEVLSPDGADAWGEKIQKIAQLPNVYMKISGYMTSCDPSPIKGETLEAYLDVALDIFGADRLLFASNYPINFLKDANYAAPLTLLQAILEGYDAKVTRNLLMNNVLRAYRI